MFATKYYIHLHHVHHLNVAVHSDFQTYEHCAHRSKKSNNDLKISKFSIFWQINICWIN